MPAKITNLLDNDQQTILYPVTKTNAVLDNNNVSVETRMSNVEGKTKYINDFLVLKISSNISYTTTSDTQITRLQEVYKDVTDNSIVFDSTTNSVTVAEDVKAVEVSAYLYIAQTAGTTTTYAIRYSNAIKLNGQDFAFNTGTSSSSCSYISSVSGSRENYIEVINSIIVDLPTARAHSTQEGQTANVFTFVTKASGTGASSILQAASTKFMFKILK